MEQEYCFFEEVDGSLGHYACENNGTGGMIPSGGNGGSNNGGI